MRGRVLIDLDANAELLVLVADGLDRLFVVQETLIDSHCKRLREGLGIVDGNVDLQLAKDGTAKPFDECGLIAIGRAAHIKPAIGRTGLGAAEVVRFNDQRVAFPSAD